MICPFSNVGCNWAGKVEHYFEHYFEHDTTATGYKHFSCNVDKDSMPELVQAEKSGQSQIRPYFKDKIQSSLRCVKCQLLLKDPVQTKCGHHFCKSCADEVIKRENLPRCPDCNQIIDNADGVHYFSDRFVKREISNLAVICPFSEAGCDWEGKFSEYENHVDRCSFVMSSCEYCKKSMQKNQLASHQRVCSAAPKPCPLAVLGCKMTNMNDKQLQQHMKESHSEHLERLVVEIASIEKKLTGSGGNVQDILVQADCPTSSGHYDSTAGQCATSLDHPPHFMAAAGFQAKSLGSDVAISRQVELVVKDKIDSFQEEVKRSFAAELRSRDDQLDSIRTTTTRLEKTLRMRNTDFEDRDFRLSLIENSNHDGTMIWKIPQFSQRKADAENGKYTSIFSLPFYTGRYGFKMCLRLYIMGDGIGKGTHLSLFFLVMRGEFDNILQWPFTHKVTFKLINQAGGRDIVDTFQPDPMSSSFTKPKSDMNIASGCPRFVSHTELERGGFIVDDTIFIKCMIDTATILLP